MRNNKYAALLCMLPVLLTAACSEQIRQRQQDFSQAQQRYRQILDEQAAVEPAPPRLRRIDVPQENAWFYQPHQATYRNQGLRETLMRLIPGLPVTYALPPDYNPSVSSAPGAVTVADHLEVIALQANVGYRLQQGVLLITPTVTVDFEIPLYGGGSNVINLSVDNLGQAAGAAADPGGFANNMVSHLSAQSDVSRLVNTVLGIARCEPDAPAPEREPGQLRECYAISPTGNLLTITARPQSLLAFEDAYQKWLEAVTRQANVKITTIRLDVTDLAQQKLDLSLVRNASIAANITNLSSNLIGISAGGGVLSIRVDDPDSSLDTSQFILQALARMGNISIDDTREVLVYNNRLVTVRNYRTQRYVQERSIQQTNTGGTSLSTPTVKIGTVETGQALNILPTLTSELIGLHVVINEAQLEQFRSEDMGQSGASRVTYPITSGADNVFDVTMRNGEIVLLASSRREELELKNDRSGTLPLWPFNHLTDNAASAGKRLTQTLFLIQANFI